MATYVLVPGAMGSAWYWHRVVPLLEARGHPVIAPDLPAEDDDAGLDAYVEVLEGAIARRERATGSPLIVVGQSMGALSATLLCARRLERGSEVALLVLLAPMIPAPGETGGEWWDATGQPEAERALAASEGRPVSGDFDPVVTFLHDVPEAIAAESVRQVRKQSSRPFADPWPLTRWPEVPTRVLIATRDRLFPRDFARRVSLERLRITPDEIDAGHLVALSQPAALVEQLERYRVEQRLE